jgi:hypothetical protein
LPIPGTRSVYCLRLDIMLALSVALRICLVIIQPTSECVCLITMQTCNVGLVRMALAGVRSENKKPLHKADMSLELCISLTYTASEPNAYLHMQSTPNIAVPAESTVSPPILANPVPGNHPFPVRDFSNQSLSPLVRQLLSGCKCQPCKLLLLAITTNHRGWKV